MSIMGYQNACKYFYISMFSISGAYTNIGVTEICPTDVIMEACLCSKLCLLADCSINNNSF